MACPQLGVILAYWKQTGVSSPKNPIALAVGVSIAKVYQIWAILYWMEGMVNSGKDGYWGTEIWVFSIENPNLLLFIVVALFATAGNLIQKKYFRQNEKGDTKPAPYKKNENPSE